MQACAQVFLNTLEHQFHDVSIQSDVGVVLPMLHTLQLYLHGAVTLSPGSSVEFCCVPSHQEQLALGNSCFHIQLQADILMNAPHFGWDALHRLATDVHCVMLTLMATDLEKCLQLPEHPLLRRVRMLRFTLTTDDGNDFDECKS
eukprot:TRINITY_DN7999_c0_g2_i1.p1 TRINITY_DN7999_c0_g2~~TRINITY_DN7999_c0_g2_i1.p1  ORF type:complete len:145 (+),score=26.16 TRINITY_DN7999_c0_g2_i1:403-837(+)